MRVSVYNIMYMLFVARYQCVNGGSFSDVKLKMETTWGYARVCHTYQWAPHVSTLAKLDEKCMTKCCDDVWLTQRRTPYGERTRSSYGRVVRSAICVAHIHSHFTA